MKIQNVCLNIVAISFLFVSATYAEELISEQEASLPPATNIEIPTRGITRGPTIEQVLPDPDNQTKGPVNVQIKFRAFNGVPIDLSTIKATYMRFPNIDLTDKFKKYVTAEGFTMKNMDVPAGSHTIKIDIKDMQGREGSSIIKMNIVK